MSYRLQFFIGTNKHGQNSGHYTLIKINTFFYYLVPSIDFHKHHDPYLTMKKATS